MRIDTERNPCMTDSTGANGSENGTQHEAPQQQPAEKVGDILRKERVTRRITVETIAKDLKLNAAYIKALEASDYDRLPADPYVRVYLRSIAGYLGLEPEHILRTFYEERGVRVPTYNEERATKLTITVKKDRGSRVPWIVVGVIVAVLAMLSYIANRAGWLSTAGPSPTTVQEPPAEPGESAPADSFPAADEEIADSLEADTLEPAADAEEAPSPPPEASDARDTMRLTLSVTKDSVWAQVFSDGESWRNFIYAGSPRSFTAVDSFNVHVGHHARVRYTLNGSRLTVKKAPKGVAVFKIDRDGATVWSLPTWNRVFKGRLE
ncbi:MAG: hypothetical protein GF418_00970 [Chitinivibrionales bacterium]|nr:hypothetical protein [Chitinivibrionales bacterium]MBD3394173.1 hypothetical protein [Chitinivibrionales bacterium]